MNGFFLNKEYKNKLLKFRKVDYIFIIIFSVIIFNFWFLKGVVVVVKIVFCKLEEIENVYDIGVIKDYNFVLVNGLVVFNCFNKFYFIVYVYVVY